jgi:hypothetical protein
MPFGADFSHRQGLLAAMLIPKNFVFALGCLGFAAGCGDSSPKLVAVSGTVTVNGKPLEGATISFSPDSTNKEGQGADDVTGPIGNYKAMTRGRSGVVPGKYKVMVSKTPTTSQASVPEAFKDDPYMANMKVEAHKPINAAKDKDAKIEGVFDREVPPEGGTIDFDVKASPEAVSKDMTGK